jgi:glycosyltransferase involved in cell wall biosynthesis
MICVSGILPQRVRFLESTEIMHPESILDCAEAVICLSHLRWNFVFQRPQHLMTRCARTRRVFFFEEPLPVSGMQTRVQITQSDGLTVVVPQLPDGLSEQERVEEQRRALDQLLQSEGIQDYVLWYYTPMALAFTSHLNPCAIVYDCMDELSAFRGAPAVLKEREAALMSRAHLVLTGGQSLYEAKKHAHSNIHPFPSSVDVAHFGRARRIVNDAPDQADIPHPRLGFFGVIDERMDLGLVAEVAGARPDWQIVMLGPVVKIDPATLPQRPNIHYLGPKSYQELPAYVAGWDVALLPFARNEATRFISPTKTPEYMAAGLPVVSTSIRDVVRPYGQQGLVRIADASADFVAACEAAMEESRQQRLAQHDAFLRHLSWDDTWNRIHELMDDVLRREQSDALTELADGVSAV